MPPKPFVQSFLKDSPRPEDKGRRFIISYRLSDDMITIHETSHPKLWHHRREILGAYPGGKAWLFTRQAQLLWATGFPHRSRNRSLQTQIHHCKCWPVCVEIHGRAQVAIPRFVFSPDYHGDSVTNVSCYSCHGSWCCYFFGTVAMVIM